MLGHQQTDIGRRQRPLPPAIKVIALADPQRPLQQPQAEASHLIRQLLVGFQGQQLQGRFTWIEQQLAMVGAGQHLGHRQPGAHQTRGHQGIERRHQARAGAAIFAQAVDGIGPLAGAPIGGQFAATKSVDGLLGIAHHHQQMLGAFSLWQREGALQDAPLNRIGVLKFIHQGHLVSGANGRDQIAMAAGFRSAGAFRTAAVFRLAASFLLAADFFIAAAFHLAAVFLMVFAFGPWIQAGQ